MCWTGSGPSTETWIRQCRAVILQVSMLKNGKCIQQCHQSPLLGSDGKTWLLWRIFLLLAVLASAVLVSLEQADRKTTGVVMMWKLTMSPVLHSLSRDLLPRGACSLRNETQMLFWLCVIVGMTLFHCYFTCIINLRVRQPNSVLGLIPCVLHVQEKMQIPVLTSLLRSTPLGFSLCPFQHFNSFFLIT